MIPEISIFSTIYTYIYLIYIYKSDIYTYIYIYIYYTHTLGSETASVWFGDMFPRYVPVLVNTSPKTVNTCNIKASHLYRHVATTCQHK